MSLHYITSRYPMADGRARGEGEERRKEVGGNDSLLRNPVEEGKGVFIGGSGQNEKRAHYRRHLVDGYCRIRRLVSIFFFSRLF